MDLFTWSTKKNVATISVKKKGIKKLKGNNNNAVKQTGYKYAVTKMEMVLLKWQTKASKTKTNGLVYLINE